MMALSGFHDKLIEASYKQDPHSQVLLKPINKLRRFWYDLMINNICRNSRNIQYFIYPYMYFSIVWAGFPS